MKICSLFTLLLLASASIAVADESEIAAAASESKFQFDGVWKPKGAVLGGVLLPPPVLAGITLRIEKNKYEVTVEGEDHSDQGTFSIDDKTTPKQMTINSTAGPNKGKTILAIFEIKNDDAMRVCYDLSGKAFPKEFTAPKGTELYLVGYRRQSDDKDFEAKPLNASDAR